MSNSLKSQLRSVIEWENPHPETMLERWTENGDEIKNASKLIVGPGEGCLFIKEGRVESIFEEEGSYDLETGNVPFWTTIKSVMYNFESSHKIGIYFYRKTEFQNCRWGTPSPIKYKDPVYNFPVALGAFGNYSFNITEIYAFMTNVIGTPSIYTTKDFQKVILSRIGQPISDFLANASFSYIDIDKHRNDIALFSMKSCLGIFLDLGFRLTDFRIEGTSFDEETQGRIGRITDMSAEAQAMRELGVSYSDYQKLEALRDVARKEGTGNTGLEMGTSFAAGQNMANLFTSQEEKKAEAPEDEIMAKMAKLKKLFEAELIDEAEYKSKKQELLSQL